MSDPPRARLSVPEPWPLLAGWCGFHTVAQFAIVLCSLLAIHIEQPAAIAILTTGLVSGALSARFVAKRETAEETDGSRAWLAFVAVGLVVYGTLIWSALRLPDYSWDGNTYHIPPIHMWARRGYVYWIDSAFPGSEYINGYPKAAEVLALLLVRSTGWSRLVTCAGLSFLPLAWTGLASIARSLGVRKAPAWGIAALFLLTPTVVWQSVTTYVDASYAAAVIAAFAGVIQLRAVWAREQYGWVEALVTGAALGLAAGLKSSGLIICGVAGLALALPVPGAVRSGFPQRITAVILAISEVAIISGFWYARNYAHTGSPIFPAGLTIAGHRVFPGLTVAQVLDVASNTPQQMAGLPDPLRVILAWIQGPRGWPATAYGWDARLGGLGYIWIVGAVPAAVLAAWWAKRKPELMVLGLMVAVSFLLAPMHWWARYTLWIYALGLPCLAVAADRQDPQPRSIAIVATRVWVTLVVLWAVFEGGLNLALMAGDVSPGDPVAGEPPVHRDAVFAPAPLFPDLRGTPLESVLRSREPVALGPLNTETGAQLLMGELCQPVGGREIVPLPRNGLVDAAALRARGIRYLILDEAAAPPRFLVPVRFRIEEADQFQLVILADP